MSYYNLFMVLVVFLIAMVAIIMTYLKRDFTKKILKRVDVLIGSILLISLWYMDILVLGMSGSGIKNSGGIIPVANSQTYAIFLFLIAAIGMIITVSWWWFENERITENKVLRKWNRFILGVLTFGAIIFITASLSLGFRGPEILILNTFNPFSLYHFSIAFIIVPTILIMLEDK